MLKLLSPVLLLASLLALDAACPVAAQPAQITNKDVFIAAEELADELELIREVMGRPYDESPRLPVAGVSMAEVFFQAQTLLRKANQLAREIAQAPSAAMSSPPEGDITAADVHALVASALEQVKLVRAELEITEPVIRQLREAEMPATGLFSTIVDANRQLDLLITNAITPADVFEEVSFALIYASGMLAERAADVDVPAAPFPGPKRPADVYIQLLDCIDIAHRIASTQGVEVLSLSSRRNVPASVEPGHVYDIANILTADLAMLAKVIGAEQTHEDLGPTPKHIFPSHAYQRAETLKRKLEALEAALR
jgi:hypothetical protein